MVDTFPITFPIPGESTISSYNYYDIQDGTGITIFQGFTHNESGTTGYALATNALYPYSIKTLVTSNVDGLTKLGTYNFDLIFNTPKRIKGKARFIGSYGTTANAGGSHVALVVNLIKVSGGVSTTISTASTETSSEVTNVTGWFLANLELIITNLTHFKKNDTLRVQVELWGDANSGSCDFFFAHDPINRTSLQIAGVPLAIQTSILQAHIPFVLDL
jgi:hypothetical protein